MESWARGQGGALLFWACRIPFSEILVFCRLFHLVGSFVALVLFCTHPLCLLEYDRRVLYGGFSLNELLWARARLQQTLFVLF